MQISYYYCTDTQHCPHAFQDHSFSRKEYQSFNGICPGVEGRQCGKPLARGHSINVLPYFVVSTVLLVLVAAVLYPTFKVKYFPEPSHGVGFVSGITVVNESDTVAKVLLERQDLIGDLTVDFSFDAGTASADNDYIGGESGRVSFADQQQRVEINIPILEDSDFDEGREVFTITLDNVVGNPSHQVIITDQPLPSDQMTKADALVRQQSVLAANLSDFARKDVIIQQALKDLVYGSENHLLFSQQLEVNAGNLIRARESYLMGLTELKKLEPSVVITSIDNWLTNLADQDAPQQYLATQAMKQHYKSYLKTRIPATDKWVQDLLDKVHPDIVKVRHGGIKS